MSVRGRASAAAAGLLLCGVALGPATADAAVSSTPAATPQLATSGTDGSVEQVRQIVQCGGTMYAVGRFSAVKDAGSSTALTRRNAFAFSATAPYRITAWNPNVNGTVNSVVCDDADGTVILGGQFTAAGGTSNLRNLAKVNAATGRTVAGFSARPSGAVQHVELVQGHLLAGGSFPGYLASLSPVTGAADGYGLPAISGHYTWDGVGGNSTHVFNMSVNATGTAVLITGVFTDVGGQHREQVFRLNTPAGARAATVSAWAPTELFGHCSSFDAMYVRDAAFSPDGSKVYLATTGLTPLAVKRGQPIGLPAGPCDAAIAYSAAETTVNGHTWINYAGCDSLYAVTADSDTVFVAGHERWIDNLNACDALGPGGRAQSGLGELNPTTGHSVPGPNRGRGFGADDLLRTSAGLWIASDNQGNTDMCGGQRGHMGICFLPKK